MTLVWVYGLFVEGRCHYIGRTMYPELRAQQHACGIMFGVDFEMRLFRKLSKERNVGLVEREFIRKYIKKGHPLRNKQSVVSLTRTIKIVEIQKRKQKSK